jgi:hypothetical protein
VILTAVQADLSQLTAIQEYGQARAQVANSQQGVTVSLAALQVAKASQSHAGAAQRARENQLTEATNRLKHLAVAAYMGLGYVTPAAGPVSAEEARNGTVTSAGGLTGSVAADAQEMLRLVAEHDRKDLAGTLAALTRAAGDTRAAGQGVAQAEATVGAAESALAASQQTLRLLTRAALTPGVAASLSIGDVDGPVAAATTTAPVPASPTILGPSILTGPEIADWFASTTKRANITVTMGQLANDYALAGQQTGVRDDLAFAQSVVETGFFAFPSGGQLTPKDNNFAGIGACDSCAHGWSFPTAQTGVSAQLELLEAYASPTRVPTPLIGPVGIGGCCPTWIALAGKWASSLVYGISIMTIYHEMLTWVIPQRLVAAGLLAAPTPRPVTPAAPAQTATPATPAITAGH